MYLDHPFTDSHSSMSQSYCDRKEEKTKQSEEKQQVGVRGNNYSESVSPAEIIKQPFYPKLEDVDVERREIKCRGFSESPLFLRETAVIDNGSFEVTMDILRTSASSETRGATALIEARILQQVISKTRKYATMLSLNVRASGQVQRLMDYQNGFAISRHVICFIYGFLRSEGAVGPDTRNITLLSSAGVGTSPLTHCSYCGQESLIKFRVCAGCRLRRYCSRSCQKKGWLAGHRSTCKSWRSRTKGDIQMTAPFDANGRLRIAIIRG